MLTGRSGRILQEARSPPAFPTIMFRYAQVPRRGYKDRRIGGFHWKRRFELDSKSSSRRSHTERTTAIRWQQEQSELSWVHQCRQGPRYDLSAWQRPRLYTPDSQYFRDCAAGGQGQKVVKNFDPPSAKGQTRQVAQCHAAPTSAVTTQKIEYPCCTSKFLSVVDAAFLATKAGGE